MESHKPKILLCEDDQNLGMVLKNYLELSDYDVTLERDGRLGLAAFQREKFEICLLDVMMPNMDGFKLAEEIRDINPDVPCFSFSAKTMKEDIIQGYKLGADDYITKPFDSEVLLLKIKAILKRNDELSKESVNVEYDLGKYHFNPKLRELTVEGKTQTLSPKENELLKMLAEYKNDLLPREIALQENLGQRHLFQWPQHGCLHCQIEKIPERRSHDRNCKYTWQWIQAGSAFLTNPPYFWPMP